MKIVRLDEQNISFEQARQLADERAQSELGDCINIAFYNEEQKLVSPTHVDCAIDQTHDCGAESYAKSFHAQLEIKVTERFSFYYRHVRNYLS